MFKRKLKKEYGFSLVELIVVVAIIGILASLVVPMYGKIAHRAKQSEAKVQLSGLHVAEKSFFTEYGAYHTAFQIIGYAPEGNVRYNIGFGAYGVVAGPEVGFNTPISTWSISTRGYCAGAGGANVVGNSCNLLVGYDGLPAPPIPAVLTTYSDGYYAGAYIYAPQEFVQLEETFNELQAYTENNYWMGAFAQPNFKLSWYMLSGLVKFKQALAMALPAALPDPSVAPPGSVPGRVRRPDVCTLQYPCNGINPIINDSSVVTTDTYMIDQTGVLTRSAPAVTCFSVLPNGTGAWMSAPGPGTSNYPSYDCSADPRLQITVTNGGAI